MIGDYLIMLGSPLAAAALWIRTRYYRRVPRPEFPRSVIWLNAGSVAAFGLAPLCGAGYLWPCAIVALLGLRNTQTAIQETLGDR